MQKLGGKTIIAPNSSMPDIDNGNEKTLVTKEWVETKIDQAVEESVGNYIPELTDNFFDI